jgi:predicted Zn-dependent protease
VGCGQIVLETDDSNPDYNAGGEGPGHRQQSLALSPRQELALGEKAYEEVLSENRGRVARSGPDYDRVKRIAEKILDVVNKNEPLRREINIRLTDDRSEPWRFDWKYAVIDAEPVNAFCLPGGEIAVYKGLLDFVDEHGGEHADDWLATVLSHEIAHALAHHANERIAHEQMDRKADEWGSGGEVSGSDRRQIGALLGVGDKLRELAFSRQQESEADHIGVFLMTFAGYDPDEAVRFWEAMAERSREQGSVPEILSDHPSDARRVAQLRHWAVRAKAALAAWKAGRIAPPSSVDAGSTPG